MATRSKQKVRAILIRNLSVLFKQELPNKNITSDDIERNLAVVLQKLGTSLDSLAADYQDRTMTKYFLVFVSMIVKKHIEDDLPPLEEDEDSF